MHSQEVNFASLTLQEGLETRMKYAIKVSAVIRTEFSDDNNSFLLPPPPFQFHL